MTFDCVSPNVMPLIQYVLHHLLQDSKTFPLARVHQYNAVRLRHVEPARVSLRHAAPSPPQVLDSSHRLAKVQSRRSPDFLSGHAYQDGKRDHRGDFTQEADLVCGVCGAHGVYETAEVRDVQRNGGRGQCGRGRKMNGVFP